MFTNPLFEWWMESLEDRRLMSAGGATMTRDAATAEPSAALDAWLHHSFAGDGGEPFPDAEKLRIELRQMAAPDAAAPVEAFITDWAIARDE